MGDVVLWVSVPKTSHLAGFRGLFFYKVNLLNIITYYNLCNDLEHI